MLGRFGAMLGISFILELSQAKDKSMECVD
jgi:hypothetical protein